MSGGEIGHHGVEDRKSILSDPKAAVGAYRDRAFLAQD
jgi:hypothetical protein